MSLMGVRLVAVVMIGVLFGYVPYVYGQATPGSFRAAQDAGVIENPDSDTAVEEVSANEETTQAKVVTDPCQDPANKPKCDAGQVPCGTVTYKEGGGKQITCSKDPKEGKCFLPAGAPAVCSLTQLDAADCIASNCFNLDTSQLEALGSSASVNEYQPGQGYVTRDATTNDFNSGAIQDAFTDQRQQAVDQAVQDIKSGQSQPTIIEQNLTQAGLLERGLISEQEAARRAYSYSGPDVNTLNPTPAATPAQLNAYYGEGNWANQYSPYAGPLTRGLLSPTEAANFIDTASPQQWQATFVPTGQGPFAPTPTAQTPVVQTFSKAFALAPQPYSGLSTNYSSAPTGPGSFVASNPTEGQTIARNIINSAPSAPGSSNAQAPADLRNILESSGAAGGAAVGPAQRALDEWTGAGLSDPTTEAGKELRNAFAINDNSFVAGNPYEQPAVYTGGSPADAGTAIRGIAGLTIPQEGSILAGLREANATQGAGGIIPGAGTVSSPTSQQQPTVTGNVVNRLRAVGTTVASTVYQAAQTVGSYASSFWQTVRNTLNLGGSVDVSGIEL